MSFYTPSRSVLNPNLVYTDHVYSSQFAHPQTHVPARYSTVQNITTHIPPVSYDVPVSLRQEYSVIETPPRSVQKLSYSQVIPQTVTTSYQPLYQGEHELEGRRIIRGSSPLSTKDSQIIYKQQPSEILYSVTRPSAYTPLHAEHERIAEQNYILDAEKQRDLDYLNWKEGRRSRSPNQIVPSHPGIPLTSSYVLQPLIYSDTKQAISNYENNLMAQLNTEHRFKQMKDDMNKCSYTYSQMIKILLALKEIEKCKNDLVNKDDFNIFLFYNSLNNNDKNKALTSDQLRISLSSLNFKNVELCDIELLFAKYSNERSADYLSLNDFKKLFIPYYINSRRKYEFDSRENQTVRIELYEHYKISNFNKKQEISIETQRIGARVIKMHLSLENSQEYYRQLMEKRLIDLAYCFDYIDRERKGVLSVQQMQTFLTGNDIYFNQEDVCLLIQRFNNAYPIGPQLEHAIKLNEFIYELSSKSRVPYLKE